MNLKEMSSISPCSNSNGMFGWKEKGRGVK